MMPNKDRVINGAATFLIRLVLRKSRPRWKCWLSMALVTVAEFLKVPKQVYRFGGGKMKDR